MDRITQYLSENNRAVLFDELSNDYIAKAGVKDILENVPVPIEIGENGLSNMTIAMGMAKIIGGDSEFKYKREYVEYIRRTLGDAAYRIIVAEGIRNAERRCYELACMYFRAAMIIDPDGIDAQFLYGRACRDAYLSTEEDCTPERDEDYVGSFKAESINAFEMLTISHPEFAMGYYYLGYAYLNMGLYTKAQLTWKSFIELSADEGMPEELSQEQRAELRKARLEIEERLESLDEPVQIERGCNSVMSGDYSGGRDILKRYTEGMYSRWWPLWYYLAVADESLGCSEAAIEEYKTALKYSPGNVAVMQELLEIYEAMGDRENIDKYSKKIEICKEQR